MRFAFLIMGKFDSRDGPGGDPQWNGPDHWRFLNLEDAARTAKRLEEEGIDCIELCGAFREEGARAVIRSHREPDPGGICDPPSRAG